MRPSNFLPRNIGIYTLPGVEEAEAIADSMIQYLDAAGVQTFVCTSRSDECLRRQIEEGSVDLMIALGGDGTMLRAGRLCAPHSVPVLGINLGHFGFLTEVERDGWQKMFPDLLEGNFRLEDRMMLHAIHRRGGQELSEWQVLNELVVCRGQIVRPIRVHANMDGYQLAAYVADGLIAATPTGSTAYALAAGGPIMPPELRNILIIPIAPHLSVDRAIILPEGAHVTITALTSHEAVLSVDGQSPVTVLDGDEIEVEASSHAASFIRFQDPSYFYSHLTHYMEQNPVTGTLP
jgi:NAD+ kinase